MLSTGGNNYQVGNKYHENKRLKEIIFREVFVMVSMHKMGAKHKLLPDEETLLVAAAKVKYMVSQPTMVKGMATQNNNVVVVLEIQQSGEPPSKKIQRKSKMAFSRRVIHIVNRKEPGLNKLSRKTKTGCVNIGALSDKRAKQSYPRLG